MDADEKASIGARIEVTVLGYPRVHGKTRTQAQPGSGHIEDIEDTVGNLKEELVAEALPGRLRFACLVGKCGDRGQEKDQK
jgi:hypothetical protein